MTPEEAKQKVKDQLIGIWHGVSWFNEEEEKVVREALEKYYVESIKIKTTNE